MSLSAMKKAFKRNRSKGQSLVEFTLVLPIFILILVAGGYIGIALYQGHMLSDAVRAPSLYKLEMANVMGAVSGGQLQSYISGRGLGGTIPMGSPVDAVNVVNVVNGPEVAIVVGTKKFTPPVTFIPSFNFRAAMPVNANLLLPANGGGAMARPLSQPFVPGGGIPGASMLTLPPGSTTTTPAPAPAPAP